MIWLVFGCSPAPQCPEGEVRDGASCRPYVSDEPVASSGVALPVGVTWQWQITGTVDASHDVDVYDVDLFDLTDTVATGLHDDGRLLICYFSAGSFEPWTPDAAEVPDEAIGNKLDGWPDERWLDHTHPAVREVMRGRLDLAAEKGCDGVEPDNVTAYSNRSGFRLNTTEQLAYNRFLGDEARLRGLSVALKNDTDQIPELVDWFDFAVNEECAAYEECGTQRPFLDAGKAVLHAEYVDRWEQAADRAAAVCGVEPGLSTIIKTWDLGPELLACD